MPGPDLFNELWYLRSYPDVAAAVSAGDIDARTHFDLYGIREGRSPGPFFQPAYYLASNPDVAAAVEQGLISPYEHFLYFGMAEGRSPVAYFDEAYYLAKNPDVAEAVRHEGATAIGHFLNYGLAEGRSPVPWFDSARYLAANPDVAAAWDASPFEHFVLYGIFEDRSLGNGLRIEFYLNDPVFNTAMGDLVFHDAVARIGAVAPFFREFEGPAGWEPAPDTPIPIDFIPPDGMKLVVPPSVVIPDGMVLPDTFEPVPPGPGPGPKPKPDPWLDCDDEGVVCLEDGDHHKADSGDQFYVLRGVDANHGTVIKIDGYEEYKHMIDLSQVKNLKVYGGPDGDQRLQLRYGEYDEEREWVWDEEATGENLALSLSAGIGHLELTGAAGSLVSFYVGKKAHSFGYEFVHVDIQDAGFIYDEDAEVVDSDEFPVLVGAQGYLSMGGDGTQVFFLDDGSMALGGQGADFFIVGDECGCDDEDLGGPSHAAIIGDYHFNGLDGDMVVINALDLGGLFEDAFRASSYSLDPARGLIRNDSSQDVDLVLGEETIAHIANVDAAGGAADAPIAFAVWGGIAMGVASIRHNGTVESLYPDATVCGCAPPVEILLGGAGSQTLKAGATWISLLGGGSGDDELIGANGANFYLGGQGDDKIMLKRTIPDSDDDLILLPDTVVFGKTAAHNGFDEIFNFFAGDGGDVLDFTAFLSGADFSFPLFDMDESMFIDAEMMDTDDGDPTDSADTGSDLILIVDAEVEPEDFQSYIDELYGTPEDRYVVLQKNSDRLYDIYFVEMDAETAGTNRVAALTVTNDSELTAWNFTPWLPGEIA